MSASDNLHNQMRESQVAYARLQTKFVVIVQLPIELLMRKMRQINLLITNRDVMRR